MFRHETVEEVIENNFETADQSKILDVDEEDVTNDENEISNKTFNNPSQVGKSDKSDEIFRCEICDFASAMRDIIVNHKEILHIWCTQCDLGFTSQKKLKNHITNLHRDA